MTVKNVFSAHLFPAKGEIYTQPSETVPGQAMEVQELLDRYARGLPIGGSKVELWQDDENELIPDVKTLDLSEIEAMKDELTRLRDKIEKDKARKQKLKQDADFNDEIERRIKIKLLNEKARTEPILA